MRRLATWRKWKSMMQAIIIIKVEITKNYYKSTPIKRKKHKMQNKWKIERTDKRKGRTNLKIKFTTHWKALDKVRWPTARWTLPKKWRRMPVRKSKMQKRYFLLKRKRRLMKIQNGTRKPIPIEIYYCKKHGRNWKRQKWKLKAEG